jgi:membrane-bound lytic murein transglycosylase D
MELRLTPPRLKILLITVPLLLWAGCAADTGFLKVPEHPQPDSTAVTEPEGTAPPLVPDQDPADSKKKDQAENSPRPIEAQRATQDPGSPEKEDSTLSAHSPRSKKTTNIAAVPEAEEGAETFPNSPKGESGTTVPGHTDSVDELTVITDRIIDQQEDVPSGSEVGKTPWWWPDLSAEKAKQAQRSISGAEGEEEMVSVPPEVEGSPQFGLLGQSDDEQSIHAPTWLEQGETVPAPEQQNCVAPSGNETPEGTLPAPGGGEAQKHQQQERLDSALEFCKASNDFWEQGDLYNAIDALDQAYSLILKVNPDDDSELLQQKEDLRFTISKRIIEVYSSRFTAANGRNSVIPLVKNSHVEKALNIFQGRERKFFLDSYRRSGTYRPHIVRALKEAGLPEELSWLPLIESGFKVKAFSRSRALGLWQFIASTGYKFGLKRDRWVDERMDPEKSTQAAILYLKELHRIFGDWTTALAAYNCGEGRVLRCIRNQKVNYLDNFWDLYERLPRETAFYVPKFLAVLHILKDPEACGFTLPPVDVKTETRTVTIDKQTHLKTISRHTGVPYSLLKEINPSLRYSVTPDRPFSFRIPKGKAEVLLSKLGDMPVWHPPVPRFVVHRVRRGESLSVIARRYGTSVRSIMRLNGLRSSHFIRTGWRLKIPMSRKRQIRMTVSSEASTSAGSTDKVRYIVQKGDSLWRIAERFGTTTKAIQSANNLSSTRLSIGQTLLVPQDLSGAEGIKTKTYTVAKGDSPYLIATSHHMKLSQFLRINRLSPRSTIFPGQTLLVKAD